MIISHTHSFVLLAPWKSASSTAHLRLAGYNESPYSRFFYYNSYLQRVVHQHITYADFNALPESKMGYFTGAFVRNPYDRVYSGFIQLQRDFKEQPNAAEVEPWVRGLIMVQLAETFSQLVKAEFDFNRWFDSVDDHQVFEVGRSSSFPLHPCHYWTGLHEQVEVDFVGKTESFERDFASFCDKVNISPAVGLNANVSEDAPDSQGSEVPRYLDRMTAQSIKKINRMFERDFELFDYAMY